MPLICNTVQQSVPLASTIQLRVSHPNNRRQVATLQPRATHTPDRRHETVKDRRYAGHHVHKNNNTRHNNQGIHDSHNSTRQTTTSYNQEPRNKTRTHKEDLLCQPSYQKSRNYCLGYENTGRTFIKTNGQAFSELNYFLHKSRHMQVADKEVLKDVISNHSEHYPVRCVLRIGIPKISTNQTNKLQPIQLTIKWDKVDQDLYLAIINERVDTTAESPAETAEDANLLISKMHQMLTKAATGSSSKKTRYKARPKLKITTINLGRKIAWNVQCNTTACEDDIALLGKRPYDMQVQINVSADYAGMDGYKLQPQKSVAIHIQPKPAKNSCEPEQYQLGKDPMPNVTKSTHLGIIRTPSMRQNIESNVEENVKKEEVPMSCLVVDNMEKTD
ncbi:Hypothetical predicted protein [Mytilus galloprovincialis]|uniref:Uncharacterized protein n=1 Tax=Mytilus galloprovincialis TaxID=29158 RepID=A0A8B6E162_MYTGA|nr:Hypothetical predicted protein [Mytilus galloprovincialis]